MWLELEHRYMSLPAFQRIEVPELVVISGENGAGKSQLLQGIWQQQVKTEFSGNQQDVLYLNSTQLGSPLDFQIGGESREQQVARVESAVQQVKTLRDHPDYSTREKLIAAAHSSLQLHIPALTISNLELRVGKSFIDWAHEDFVNYTPTDLANRDLFSVNVSDAFSRYNQVVTANDLEALRESKGQSHGLIRSEADLQELFGLPPWELMNGALKSVGLPLHFEVPVLSMLPSVTPPQLIHDQTGESLVVSALSSGEKTLLSIALSIYSASGRREFLKVPKLVLLDEPDATLHPSMIQSLLRLVKEQFIDSLGLSVVIVTHSPTTVAIAPSSSLYIMSKTQTPRLRPASSTDEALSNLLVGVPTVSVSADHRRIVVVESPNDERLYTKIANLLGNRVNQERSLVFMAAGSSSLPDGSAAVIDLVRRLRENGNRAVWGLIDRDDRASSPSEFVHMDGSRYTLENFVVDPLSLGLFLLLENFGPTTTALSGINYVNFNFSLHAQTIVDHIGSAGAPEGALESVSVGYVGGTVEVPTYWLSEPGHRLTERLAQSFDYLRKFEHDRTRLLDQIVDRVWASRPELVPLSQVKMLDTLLTS